jgi:hypothetical protein
MWSHASYDAAGIKIAIAANGERWDAETGVCTQVVIPLLIRHSIGVGDADIWRNVPSYGQELICP